MNNKPEWIKRFGEKFTIGVEIDNDNSYKQVAYQNTNGVCSFLQESDLLDFISKEISKAEQAMNKRCNEECEKRILKEVELAKKQGREEILKQIRDGRPLSEIVGTIGKTGNFKLTNNE